jgi:predicted RNA methylase
MQNEISASEFASFGCGVGYGNVGLGSDIRCTHTVACNEYDDESESACKIHKYTRMKE